MNTGLTIEPLARTERNALRFLKVSYGIYGDDPHWVAPLLLDQKKVFLDVNPLFQHAEMQLWVATQGGRDVGRIAGIIDRNYQEFHKDAAAFFGFYECANDAAISGALFDTVKAWARDRQATQLLGPMNPTTNDECGLLIDGFDSSPYFMMTYNPRYYLDLFEAAGLVKAKDLLAFHIDLAHSPMDRLGKIAQRVRERHPELKFHAVSKRTLTADLGKIKEVYNAAWETNWGFVPMTDAELDFMAGRLKPLLMEGLIWIAQAGEEPVAFLLALADYNLTFKPLRGRLLTPRLFGALPALLGWKYPPRSRVLTLGAKPRYRGKGLESVMLYEGLQTGFRAGFTEAEASWILEDNVMMRRVLEVFGARAYKTYRIYALVP